MKELLVKLRGDFTVGEGTIRLKLELVPSVIAATFILHNLAKRLFDSDFEGDDVVDEDDDLPGFTDRTDNYSRAKGQDKRQHNLYLYIPMIFTLSRIMLTKVVFLFTKSTLKPNIFGGKPRRHLLRRNS